VNKFFTTLGAGAVVALSGCASIVSDSSYPVNISSTPDQASYEIVDFKGVTVQRGTTPATVTLKSGSGSYSSARYTVKFQKEGFAEQTVQLNSSLDGWYFGNIIFGGLIGMLIVDPITGAMWKLPESATVSLNQSPANTVADDTAVESVEPAAEPVTEEQQNTEAAQPEQAEVGDSLSFVTIDQIPESLRSELVRIN